MSDYGAVIIGCWDSRDMGGQFFPLNGSYQSQYANSAISIVAAPAAFTEGGHALKIEPDLYGGAGIGYGVSEQIQPSQGGAPGHFVFQGTLVISSTSGTGIVGLMEFRLGGAVKRRLEINVSSRILRYQGSSTGGPATNGSTALALDTRYQIRWEHNAIDPVYDFIWIKTDAGAWVLEIALFGVMNGYEVTESTSRDYVLGATGKSAPSGTIDIYWKHVIVQEPHSGTPPNRLGPVTCKYKAANATGTYNEFTAASSGDDPAANAADVDEVPPDNITSYDAGDAVGETQSYGITNADAGDTPLAVTPVLFYTVFESPATGLMNISAGLKLSGAEEFGNANGPGTTAFDIWSGMNAHMCHYPISQKPGGGDWTETDFNNIEVMVEIASISGAPVCRLTQVGANYCIDAGIGAPAFPTVVNRAVEVIAIP